MQSESGPPVRPADPAAIAEAAAVLRAGGLVAFPTETVYGLGGDATSDAACARIFAAKGRPRFNPLIVHVTDAAAAARLGQATRLFERLAERFWPGPLTIVLRRRPDCPVALLASAGLDTLALRVPSHPVARALIEAAGRPIAAPSANRSNAISPTEAGHVVRSLGGAVDFVLDGGATEVGVESTVVDLSEDPPALLRHGGVTLEALREEAPDIVEGRAGPARSPGMLARHYAPVCPVRLDATGAGPGEALLAYGPGVPDGPLVRNLSPSGDLVEAAVNLFRMLHELEALRPAGIAVMPIPDYGIGRAICDRLRRAAA